MNPPKDIVKPQVSLVVDEQKLENVDNVNPNEPATVIEPNQAKYIMG